MPELPEKYNAQTNSIPCTKEDEKESVDLSQHHWRKLVASRIKEQIDQYSLDLADDGYRSHLGWSVIGHECSRYLYYHWHWFKKEVHKARNERIFEAGNNIETEIRSILKSRGAKFLDTVDVDGKQITVSDLNGHFGGSTDGVFIWPEIGLYDATILECKSSKTGAPFNDLNKVGLALGKQRHFIQGCGYGAALGIKYGLYVCMNKNDSDIYCEVFEVDNTVAEQNKQKALYIITTEQMPVRISNKRNFWKCNMCTMQGICHDNERPIPNCRNCRNCKPIADGGFHCNHWNADIPKSALISGCSNHSFLPY
jgi:hypothetical protein